jgi:hypothetical protein
MRRDQHRIIAHRAIVPWYLEDSIKLNLSRAVLPGLLMAHLRYNPINKPPSLQPGLNTTSNRTNSAPLHLQVEQVPLTAKRQSPFQRRVKRKPPRSQQRGRHTMLHKLSMRSKWQLRDGVRLKSSRLRRMRPHRLKDQTELSTLIRDRVKDMPPSVRRMHRCGRSLVPLHLKDTTTPVNKHRMRINREALCRCLSPKFTVNPSTTPTSLKQVCSRLPRQRDRTPLSCRHRASRSRCQPRRSQCLRRHRHSQVRHRRNMRRYCSTTARAGTLGSPDRRGSLVRRDRECCLRVRSSRLGWSIIR